MIEISTNKYFFALLLWSQNVLILEFFRNFRETSFSGEVNKLTLKLQEDTYISMTYLLNFC